MKTPFNLWKDVTKFGSGIPVVQLETRSLRIIVHKYLGAGDIWFLTCYELNFDGFTLLSKNPEDAKKEAFTLIKKRLEVYQSELEEMA